MPITDAPLTLLLLAAIGVLGALQMTVLPSINQQLLLRPYSAARGIRRWTLLTSGFVHADFMHLLLNGMSLWFFGPLLEQTIGTFLFGLLYLTGLVLSQWRRYAKHRDDPGYATLGASGAISAVVFACIVHHPQQSLFILPIPFPIPAPLFGVGYLAYSWWSARRGRDNINHDAHLDGALTGLLFVALTSPGAYLQALDWLLR